MTFFFPFPSTSISIYTMERVDTASHCRCIFIHIVTPKHCYIAGRFQYQTLTLTALVLLTSSGVSFPPYLLFHLPWVALPLIDLYKFTHSTVTIKATNVYGTNSAPSPAPRESKQVCPFAIFSLPPK